MTYVTIRPSIRANFTLACPMVRQRGLRSNLNPRCARPQFCGLHRQPLPGNDFITYRIFCKKRIPTAEFLAEKLTSRNLTVTSNCQIPGAFTPQRLEYPGVKLPKRKVHHSRIQISLELNCRDHLKYRIRKPVFRLSRHRAGPLPCDPYPCRAQAQVTSINRKHPGCVRECSCRRPRSSS